MRRPCILHLFIGISTALSGCAGWTKPAPLPETFLEGAPPESSIPRVPFQQAWASDAKFSKEIRELYLPPVRTDKIDPATWTMSLGVSITSAEDFHVAVQELALFFHHRLTEELERVFAEHPRLKVVSSPSANAVNLELALTEVVFSRPIANAAAMAAPVPGVGYALSALTTPHVAFAGRFTSPDGAVLLGTVGDRRTPPLRPVDLNKFTLASSNRDIVSQWARELAEAIQFDTLTPVERSSRFSLLPW